MFKSLDSKLILTYALIVAFSLAVSGAAAVAVFNRLQLRAVEGLMRGQAAIVAGRVEQSLATGQPLAELRRQLQQQARMNGLHIVLANGDGVVMNDLLYGSGDRQSLEGQRFEDLPERPAMPPGPPRVRPPAQRVVSPVNRLDIGDQTLVYALVAIPRVTRPDVDAPAYVGLLRPVQEVQAWPTLALPLGSIGLAVFAVTTLVGVLLARSITEPISHMTRASEAMARGDYAQKIEVWGDDEVARLGRAFNQMAREVDRAHRMQRDFLINVSHDLKTPLTSIQGFAQAMGDGSLQTIEQYRTAGGIIHEEAERMRRLIGQLLDLAKLQAGAAALVTGEVDFAALLLAAAAAAEKRAAVAGVRFTSHVPPALPMLVGDGRRLEQVVGNLLDNALRYTLAGGEVELSAAAAPDGVTFSVRDSGAGIPKDEVGRLFERFYRGDQARADGGSGLGLAIVKEIVEAHAGRIEVASEVGRGSRFTVFIPQTSAPFSGPRDLG